MSEQVDWRAIGAALCAPFAPEQVEWRIQGKANAKGKAQVVAYLDARAVAERLDDVVGPGGWSFDWTPIHVDGQGNIQTARGALVIHDVSKSDVGTASTFEPSKGCVSDTLKRCAVLWGIGRYLYSVPQVWVTLDERGHIPSATLIKLCESLRRRQTAA